MEPVHGAGSHLVWHHGDMNFSEMSSIEKGRFFAFIIGIMVIGFAAGSLAAESRWGDVIPVVIGLVLVVGSQSKKMNPAS